MKLSKMNLMSTGFTRVVTAILFVAISFSFANAQEKKGARLEYTKQVAELGQIAVESLEPVTMEIEFVNEGDEPLVVSSVRGCCGTRIKDYTKQPIMPGEKGIVNIEFRLAPRPHNINRSVSIMSNDERGMKVFRIRGEVVEESAEVFGTQVKPTAGPRAN